MLGAQQTCYFMPGQQTPGQCIGINVKTLSLAVLTPNVPGTLALSMMLLATQGDSTDRAHAAVCTPAVDAGKYRCRNVRHLPPDV